MIFYGNVVQHGIISKYIVLSIIKLWKLKVLYYVLNYIIEEDNNATSVDVELLESKAPESGKSNGVQVYLKLVYDK